MYLIRDLMYCKPGKVKPMIEKFLAIKKMSEKNGMKMRIMTDVAGERYWTLVSEMEVESIDKAMSMHGMSEDDMKEMEKVMKDYHDLVQNGRREIYKLEG